MALPKTYEAVARFGAVSDTGDPDGEIVVTGRVATGDLPLPTGTIMQRPPAVLRGQGQGTTRVRRGAGRRDRRAPSPGPCTVYRFEERSRGAEHRAFVIECSSGTYVRTLIAELGDAYCERLRRTRIGDFDVEQADPGRPIELSSALSFMPAARLDVEQGRRVGHGQALTLERVPDAAPLADGVVARLIDPAGLVGLGTVDVAGGALRPIVGLRR